MSFSHLRRRSRGSGEQTGGGGGSSRYSPSLDSRFPVFLSLFFRPPFVCFSSAFLESLSCESDVTPKQMGVDSFLVAGSARFFIIIIVIILRGYFRG